MSAGAVTKLAKPVMRGMHVQQIKKILVGATVVSVLFNLVCMKLVIL